MMNKSLLLIFVFILLISFVSADIILYDIDFEDNTLNGFVSLGGTTSGSLTTTSTDAISGTYSLKLFENVGQYMVAQKFYDVQNYTLINYSYKVNYFSGNNNYGGTFLRSADSLGSQIDFLGGCRYFGGNMECYDAGSLPAVRSWVRNTVYKFDFIINLSSQTYDLYVDNVLEVDNFDFTTVVDNVFNNSYFGTGGTSTNELWLYDDIVITALGVDIVSNFTVSAKSFWDNSSISNFSIDIDGSFYNTSNGTIVTGLLINDSSLHNITFFGDWFNKTYENYNVSSNLEGILKQTDITFNFKFNSGDLISTPINLTSVDTGNFFNVSNGSENIFPNAGIQNFTIRCDNNVFAPFNISLNLNALDNLTFNYTVNETPTVITFLDINTSSPIENGSVIVYFPSGFTLNLSTNSSGSINFSYIQNNTVEFGEYIFGFSRFGYLPLNISATINESTIPFSATYNITRARLIVNIYDRVTRELLTGVNVSIAFVGLFNDTTTTGNLIKDNLTIVGGDYLIYASADGYKTSVRGLTFTNQEEFTLNFYIMNLSEPTIGTIFVTTTDSFFREISGAKVQLLEYIPDDKNFVNVEECSTNINAQCSMSVELNTKVYFLRGIATIDGSPFIAETSQNGEIFTVDNDNRNLIFYTRTDFETEPSGRLVHDIDEDFVNNVSTITVDFYSLDGGAYTVCIEYFRQDGSDWVSVNLDCLTSSSAIQNIDSTVTLNRSNTYKADIYIENGDSDIFLRSYPYLKDTSFSEVFKGHIIEALIVAMWIFTLAVCVHSKNMVLWFSLAMILAWVQLIFFPSIGGLAIAVFKSVISGMSLLVARKKRDLQ